LELTTELARHCRSFAWWKCFAADGSHFRLGSFVVAVGRTVDVAVENQQDLALAEQSNLLGRHFGCSGHAADSDGSLAGYAGAMAERAVGYVPDLVGSLVVVPGLVGTVAGFGIEAGWIVAPVGSLGSLLEVLGVVESGDLVVAGDFEVEGSLVGNSAGSSAEVELVGSGISLGLVALGFDARGNWKVFDSGWSSGWLELVGVEEGGMLAVVVAVAEEVSVVAGWTVGDQERSVVDWTEAVDGEQGLVGVAAVGLAVVGLADGDG
jgi:hypothetical protein